MLHALPVDPEAEMAKLGPGLDEVAIHEAIQVGRRNAVSVPPNIPPWFPGLAGAAYAIDCLRTRLARTGWKNYQRDGISGVMNPAGTVMLMFVPGDRLTGSPDLEAQPRSKKRGPRSIGLVESNQRTIWEFLSEVTPLFVPEPTGPVTWFVLTHHDRSQGIVQVEVSQPSECDPETKKVRRWKSRIPLRDVELPEVIVENPAAFDIEFDGERTSAIDIPIEPIDSDESIAEGVLDESGDSWLADDEVVNDQAIDRADVDGEPEHGRTSPALPLSDRH